MHILNTMGPAPEIPDHTLLHVIGRGSYGEVWLAKNILGTPRAVKVVRRQAFDSDRPYLREFAGIRRCEPVSRAHSGLIDILHLGNNEAEGWFYYVMELADSAEPESGASYRPATLANRLANGKSMEVQECVQLAETLAGALAFLHERGLIHRDVKPSNVLFVDGSPKLADIGLVAEIGSSRSFVGTEGFVPLEGPGTERADVYALGKVLYEALTGLDRTQFPLLPADWKNAADREQRLEMNHIILKACESRSQGHYRSAREMLADIARLASGLSVTRLSLLEKRLRWLRNGILITAGAAAVFAGFFWMGKQQLSRERSLRERAESAETKVREDHASALLASIQSARHDSQPGSAARALESASILAKIKPSQELRDEVAYMLARGEFVERPDLSVSTIHLNTAVHSSTQKAALIDVHPGGNLRVEIRQLGTSKPLAECITGIPEAFLWAVFSPNGQKLLLSCRFGGGVIIDATSGAVEQTIRPGLETTSSLKFCGPNADKLVRRSSSGGLVFYSLPSGERTVTQALNWPLDGASPHPAPDGKSVIFIHSGSDGRAARFDCSNGAKLWEISGPDESAIAWSPDAKRIALRSGNTIQRHDATTGDVVDSLPLTIYNAGTRMQFIGNADVLAFTTWSHGGWYDFTRQEFHTRLANQPVDYSTESRLLCSSGKTVEISEWRPSRVLRVEEVGGNEKRGVHLAFSPEENFLLTTNGTTAQAIDLRADAPPRPRAWKLEEISEVQFVGDSQLEIFTPSGFHATAWTGEFPTSPPPLDESRRFLPMEYVDFVDRTPDDRFRAVATGRGIRVWNSEGTIRSFPHDGSSGHPVSLSPDGRWLAVGTQHGTKVRIFDLQDPADRPCKEIPCGISALGVFSPDGKWLICSGTTANVVFQTGTWQEIHRIPRKGGLFGFIHFTADARFAMLNRNHAQYDMVECGTWRKILSVTSLGETQLSRTALSPTGRYFAAVGFRREVNIWDLERLRRELSVMGL